MKLLLSLLPVSLLLVACGSTTPACEEIEEIMAQRRECEEMAKRIEQASSVIVRTNLQEVYEKQCENIRFYRDNFDDNQVCSAKEQSEAVKEAEKASEE